MKFSYNFQLLQCSDPKSREVKALAIEEFAHNVCGSSMEVAKSNIEQFKESVSAKFHSYCFLSSLKLELRQ